MLSEKVAIGVVPRDRFSMFPKCLEAVYTHTDMPFRVVVVAGAADMATRDYLQKLQEEKENCSVVLVHPLLMQGEARNIAMRQVKERFFVVLENDTIVHKNWLRPLLDCMRGEGAAVVAPLILKCWDGTVHAAGGMIEVREKDGAVEFHHAIMYQGVKASSMPPGRIKIGYPETHCMLIDRQLLPENYTFDDVEPFDADLGLMLQNHGLTALIEPGSVATYAEPPDLELCDIAAFKFRWNPDTWADRNRRFMQKWNVIYDASPKRMAYRRQYLKLGLANWYANKLTIWMANGYVRVFKYLRFKLRFVRTSQL
jgi:cellulose synthase/poly-beta-1,6-N-acetylglucosamine synthase-like glycosyltransferase